MPSYSGVWTLSAQYNAQSSGNWPLVLPAGGSFAYLFSASATDNIQYFSIPSGGTTATFGGRLYKSTTMYFNAALSNSIYGMQAAMSSPYASNLAYIILRNGGSKAFWGNLTQNFATSSTCANSTRGLIGADSGGTPAYNTINYITWATTGNASSFGQISRAAYAQQGSGLASTTRALFVIGYDGVAAAPYYATSAIEYVTIATTGNSTFFGNLVNVTRRYTGSTSSSTRGIILGGYNNDTFHQSAIDYVTIATTGNATNFGNLTGVKYQCSATSDSIKAVACGGTTTGSVTVNIIEYVTIATTGNGTSYGTLSVSTNVAACSNAHGGL